MNERVFYRRSGRKTMAYKPIEDEIEQVAVAFEDIEDFQGLIDKVKNKRIVMLGESSHGTQEFYEYRRLISNELIKHHDFDFIAVEGDWPACQAVNEYIQANSSQDSLNVITRFSRWPTWMWGNTEVTELMEDLKSWNQDSNKSPVGFHGLDVYSLNESIEEVINKLNDIDPILALKAKHYYSCFDPYKHDEKAYVSSLFKYPEGCEEKVVKALEAILEKNLKDKNAYFDVVQNAKIVKNAERYYHTMISHDDDSWNVRDGHMMETLESLLDHYGPESKAIIWAHNTHIGDYRATDMVTYGQVNLGGLARERFGKDDVALVGFTTFTGQVVASTAWDGPIEVMDVPRGKEGSLEYALHQGVSSIGKPNFYLDFDLLETSSSFNEYMGHRAIGVVYHPEHEHRGNYVPTIASQRYDAMVFFDETSAVKPLNIRFENDKVPETYPFGDRI